MKKIVCFVMLLVPILLCAQETLESIESFWNYISLNEEKLYADTSQRTSVWDDVGAFLQDINPGLSICTRLLKKGKMEFIISAFGRSELFPLVDRIVLQSPQLQYLQPVSLKAESEPTEIIAGDIRILPSDVHYYLEEEGDQYVLNIPLSENQIRIIGDNSIRNARYLNLLRLMVIDALGERLFATRIKRIEFNPANAFKPLRNICFLRDDIMK